RGAGRAEDRAAHLDDLAAAGPLVQEVDVLRDYRADEPRRLEPGERTVRVVRLRLGQDAEARCVEPPDLLRVGAEGLDRAVLERVETRPEPRRRPEVGDTALRRHACPGQEDARLPLAPEGGEAGGAPRALVAARWG